MPSADYPTTAGFYDGFVVHLQGFDRCTTTGSSAKYERAACIPGEMIAPALAQWVKDGYFGQSLRIKAVLLGCFVAVARKTDLTKIFDHTQPTRTFGYDVVDVHCLTRVIFRGVAIRAPSPISGAHLQTQGRGHGHQ